MTGVTQRRSAQKVQGSGQVAMAEGNFISSIDIVIAPVLKVNRPNLAKQAIGVLFTTLYTIASCLRRSSCMMQL
jgi:hypothetical protein